ncbi:MAG: factor-independent urate hydroxylase [Bryobacteraceae bacterium]
MHIVRNSYGKSKVRVARVVRGKDHHDFYEMTVQVALEGDFEASYRDGDNSLVLPTDTMKNTVYALAQDPAAEQPESFARLLAMHFLGRLRHVTSVKVDTYGHLWSRNGPFSFTAGPAHLRTATVEATREKVSIESGVEGYLVLKTTGSAFEGFLRDEHTTLPEASDRILATSLDAAWLHNGDASWDGVMRLITDTFAGHASKSVQHTLYAIGETVLKQFESIERIRLTMPNKHYLPTKHADVFIPTDEPHGLIEAVLSR